MCTIFLTVLGWWTLPFMVITFWKINRHYVGRAYVVENYSWKTKSCIYGGLIMARVGSNSLGGGRKHVSNGGGNLKLNMEELICLEFYAIINWSKLQMSSTSINPFWKGSASMDGWWEGILKRKSSTIKVSCSCYFYMLILSLKVKNVSVLFK